MIMISYGGHHLGIRAVCWPGRLVAIVVEKVGVPYSVHSSLGNTCVFVPEEASGLHITGSAFVNNGNNDAFGYGVAVVGFQAKGTFERGRR